MGRPYVIEQTVGAQIGNEAEFKLDFFGNGHYGNVNVDASYDEKLLKWSINKLDLEVFDKDGNRVPETNL